MESIIFDGFNSIKLDGNKNEKYLYLGILKYTMISTVKVSTKTKSLLSGLKIHRREPFEEVILNLIANNQQKIKPTPSLSLNDIKTIAIPILKKYGVKKAGLFGSFARGEARNDSDIDLLIEFSDEKMAYKIVDLHIELEEVFKRKVDLVSYKWIDPHLSQRILADEVRII